MFISGKAAKIGLDPDNLAVEIKGRKIHNLL